MSIAGIEQQLEGVRVNLNEVIGNIIYEIDAVKGRGLNEIHDGWVDLYECVKSARVNVTDALDEIDELWEAVDELG